jgi:ABC-type multidrug transport system ATPase subunit
MTFLLGTRLFLLQASVLFTIHQPASDIFESFDRIILLNKGRVMYQGTVEQAPDYFEARGYPLKPRYNPADFFLVGTLWWDIVNEQ